MKLVRDCVACQSEQAFATLVFRYPNRGYRPGEMTFAFTTMTHWVA